MKNIENLYRYIMVIFIFSEFNNSDKNFIIYLIELNHFLKTYLKFIFHLFNLMERSVILFPRFSAVFNPISSFSQSLIPPPTPQAP